MKPQSALLLLLTFGSFLTATATHAACAIQLSEPQINYGDITRGQLLTRPGNALAATELRMGDKRESDLTVICDRPSSLALTFSAPVKENESYAFGEQGRATLTLHDVTLDGHAVMIDSAGRQAAKMAFSGETPLRFLTEGQPASGMTLRAKVRIATWLPAAVTRVREREQWQLNGRFLVSSEG